MADQNLTKLRLRLVVKLMIVMSVFAFGWVLFGSLPDRTNETTEVTRFDVADMRPGEYRLLEWRKKPLFIVKRKPEWEAALMAADAALYHDPDSSESSQPQLAVNPLRSVQNGWFVTLGLGTGMGCTLVFSEPDAAKSGVDAAGGFVDGCDQSNYDLAGRVYVRQHARHNTVVPRWSLVDGEILVGR